VNLFIKDLLAFNGIVIVIALILFGLGRTIMEAIFISLLSICALLLIGGGALGFLLSSVSFDSLLKHFRIGREGDGEKDEEELHNTSKQKSSDKEKREQVNMGKRMVIIGIILLGESLLISLFLIR
jgi:hypothetical protein